MSQKFKILAIFSTMMGLIVILSNYLVQFPINHFGLQKILTYGAFSYPIIFLITDLTNRAYGKQIAKKVVYLGFVVGILLTLFVSTNFSDIISVRIAIGSGTAFLAAQIIDIHIFDKLRENKIWFAAPLISSIIGSSIDTFIFFSIAFYGTEIPWVTLAIGDFVVKLLMAMIMLIPFRVIIIKLKDVSDRSISYKIS
jgi:uncharacterized integral membrane protein (TIGR00697 family)|tara:strand:- start:224 stop:814 length:591 start_codon:yes stop_codon:yes gene_type:complete